MTQSCETKDCAHTWEEHADAWFVSGVLLSSIHQVTPTVWSNQVIDRGDSWILLPSIEVKFEQYRSIMTSMSNIHEHESSRKGLIPRFTTQRLI